MRFLQLDSIQIITPSDHEIPKKLYPGIISRLVSRNHFFFKIFIGAKLAKIDPIAGESVMPAVSCPPIMTFGIKPLVPSGSAQK
jgi:hypothetical protein